MKNFLLLLSSMLLGIALLALALLGAPLKNAQAGTDLLATPTSAAWQDGLPPKNGAASRQSVGALPTPAPGESLVYFTPWDSVYTGSVITLYNTDSVAHSVTLRGYTASGVQVYYLNFNIGATSFQRLISDDLVASPPASWTTPVPYVVSYGDSVLFASLSLPKGVKADGYNLFDPSGLIDPISDQGAIPLRFSSDPATVFMPAIQN